MVNTNSKEDMVRAFSDYLYDRLPLIYRTSDKDLILRRFIDCFAEGGYAPLLNDTMDIMNLIDIDKCPSRFLPYLCRMNGLEYTKEIPELFQRRLLKYIVELYKRKGTKSVVRFIARELTGFESEIIENKDFTAEEEVITGWTKEFVNYRNFILKLTAPYEDSSLYSKEDIVKVIIKDFLPTNSNVLIITSYWFREEAEILKNIIEEELTTKVTEYNDVVLSPSETSIEELRVTPIMWKDDVHDIYDSTPIEVTNLDTIKPNVEIETGNNVATSIEDEFTTSSKVVDEYSVDVDKQDSTEIDTYRNSMKDEELHEPTTSTTESIDILVDNEGEFTHNSISGADDSVNKDRFNMVDLEENYSQDSVISTNYDIIGIGETEYNHSVPQEVVTSRLNISIPLITNTFSGSYDTVKEVGKPNKIIII